jgi:hypothetical protein
MKHSHENENDEDDENVRMKIIDIKGCKRWENRHLPFNLTHITCQQDEF